MRNILLILFLQIGFSVFAKEIPPVTKHFVNDYADVISPEDEAFLEQKLKGYFDSTSTQIVIVLENTLEGDDVFGYSQRLAKTWGIGEKGKNNGLLIYAAIKDRKLQIQVGYGLEGSIPDGLTSRVRRNIINPAFKSSQYAQGLNEATTVFMKAASGEFVNDREDEPIRGFKPKYILIIIVIILAIIFSSRGRGGRGNRGSGGFGGPIFWGGTFGSGGFSSGGGSGGGFGGFGGGSFGGGGSGGSW